MKVLKIAIIFFLILVKSAFGQQKLIKNIQYRLNKDSSYYERNARRILRKSLIKNNIYNIFTANDLLKGTELLIVPRFKVVFDEHLNYSNLSVLLSQLNVKRNVKFHSITIFKSNQLIGYYASDGLGSGGIMLDEQSDISNKSKIPDKKIFDLHSRVFFIEGMLHTWWLIKDDSLLMYNLLDDKFYEPQEFIDKFYSNERLLKNFKYMNDIKY